MDHSFRQVSYLSRAAVLWAFRPSLNIRFEKMLCLGSLRFVIGKRHVWRNAWKCMGNVWGYEWGNVYEYMKKRMGKFMGKCRFSGNDLNKWGEGLWKSKSLSYLLTVTIIIDLQCTFKKRDIIRGTSYITTESYDYKRLIFKHLLETLIMTIHFLFSLIMTYSWLHWHHLGPYHIWHYLATSTSTIINLPHLTWFIFF